MSAPSIRESAWRRAQELLAREINLDAACSALDPYLPRKPGFWVDAEVRRAALLLHGELYQHEARAVIAHLYGPARCPARASFDRLWQKVAKAKKAGWTL